MFHESSKVLAILIRSGPPKGRSVGKTKLLDEYSGYLLNGPRIECVVPEALSRRHHARGFFIFILKKQNFKNKCRIGKFSKMGACRPLMGDRVPVARPVGNMT